jgi:hypothetical protein
MMHHLANLLADKHAKDKTEWLNNNSDECFNYTHSNCGIGELKVTNESPDPRKSNIIYLGAYI